MSNHLPKPKPIRKSIADVDLVRFTDAVILGENLQKLAPGELADVRKSQPYQMLMRVGTTMYRAGEQGLRPRPALMVVEKPEAKEEQATPVEV
jgi:hypothetical protein